MDKTMKKVFAVTLALITGISTVFGGIQANQSASAEDRKIELKTSPTIANNIAVGQEIKADIYVTGKFHTFSLDFYYDRTVFEKVDSTKVNGRARGIQGTNINWDDSTDNGMISILYSTQNQQVQEFNNYKMVTFTLKAHRAVTATMLMVLNARSSSEAGVWVQYDPINYIIQKPKPTATPTPSPTPTPTPVPTATPTPTPVITPSPAATAAASASAQFPTVTVSPGTTASAVPSGDPAIPPEDTSERLFEGDTFNKSDFVYRITKDLPEGEVECSYCYSEESTVSVPKTVSYQGETYKVTSIGDEAFYKHTKLKNIILGNNIKKTGHRSFYGCTSLITVDLDNNLKTIGEESFTGCKSLVILTIPKNVKTIGKKAFYNCKKLRYIRIKTKKLTSSTVGSNSFGKGYSKPRVKPEKKVWKSYSKILLKKGKLSGKAVFVVSPVALIK